MIMTAAIDYRVCLNRNGYVNKDGLREVVIEIRQGQRRNTFNTHVKAAPQDFARGRVLPSHPNHDLLNKRIRRIVRRMMELEDEMLDARQEPTPQRLIDAYNNNQTASATIREWIDAVITPSGRKEVTKDIYASLAASMDRYKSGIRIRDLTHDIIMRWKHHMTTQQQLCDNTVALRMKALRCLVNEAIKRGVIKHDEDPFRNIRIPEIKARREHLTEQELNAIEHTQPKTERLKHIRDAFLFCCYTGLRWGDFRRLTNENLKGNILTIRQHKTGNTQKIPLNVLWKGRPLTIVEKYGNIERLAQVGDNSECNKRLKDIATMADIGKHLHWHLARHTCATLLNQRGLRMQEIQFVLGHQRQATTEKHYAETLFEQVHDSLEKAFQ